MLLGGAMGFLLVVLSAVGQVTRPIPIPGRVEAENYDTNGPGVSYYDNSAGNSGGVYRLDDVDIEPTSDVGGGFNIGWIASGEWLHYTLNVQATAVYQFAFRVASANGAGNIQVALDGRPLCTVITPLTGGWQTWQTVTVSNLVLQAGTRLLRLDFRVGGQNLNYFQITKQRDLVGGYLRASGKQIVDGAGNNFVLRGIGLGNWMLQEPYMMEVSGIVENQQQLRGKIAELVGNSNRDAFYVAWLTNSLRAADVAAIAAAGFNSIRVPLHYNLFTLPIEREPVAGQNTWLPDGFKLLDDLLGWCETNQVYLILDMHACPGGQGYDKPISDYNPPTPSLWENSTNRAKLTALWRELAGRYSNRSRIGGYDLINEPNWTFEGAASVNGCNDQTNAPLRQLYQSLTAAIREVDTNHLIFIEGNCWAGNYNGVLPPWDGNLVVSFHKYWDDPGVAAFQTWVDKRDQWNLPLWLGESGENSNDWYRSAVRNAEFLNIGWSWWPWKKIGSTTGPRSIVKPAGYQNILDYWNSTAPRPNTNDAFNGLLALATASRLENCPNHVDVIDALLRPNPQGQTLPFSNAAFPGIIFAANYDLGVLGEAYFDQSTNNPQNTGALYRNDAVDIEACNDALPPGVGYDVGWIESGDWLKYTVSSFPTGVYSVVARVAAPGGTGRFHLEIGGLDVTGIIPVNPTGGWQSWSSTSPRVFTNNFSANTFRFVVDASGFNLNWMQFVSLLAPAPTNLVAAADFSKVQLTWAPAVGATSYAIRRATSLGGVFKPIATGVSAGGFADLAVTNGMTFFYTVVALNAYGESSPSVIVSADVPFPMLSAQFASNGLVMTWPNAATPLTVLSATNLHSPPFWTPVAMSPSWQSGYWALHLPMDNSNRFFRLSVP